MRKYLLLNVNKTKEVGDLTFRRTRTVCILGQATDVVEDYDYLGIHMEGQHRGFKQKL